MSEKRDQLRNWIACHRRLTYVGIIFLSGVLGGGLGTLLAPLFGR